MNSIDFCYWLQGYFELSGDKAINQEQTQSIKKHLSLVFLHEIDPIRNEESNTSPTILNQVHNNDELMRC